MTDGRQRKNIEGVVGDLLRSTDPVSFYDAMMVIRQLREGEPSYPMLAALVELHDAEHTTAGGREVLANFLRRVASRHAEQRALAAAPLELSASGKTARIDQPGELLLSLEERRTLGFRWRIEHTAGNIHLEHCGSRAHPTEGKASRAEFRVVLSSPGVARLRLIEEPPEDPYGDTEPELRQPRHFELAVIVANVEPE